jgi:hypothetical protein
LSDKWLEEYERLTGYINNHPEIVITRERTFTPKESKAGFYELFNSVLTTFIEDNFPILTEESKRLVNSYNEAAAETKYLFDIEKNSSLPEFYRFLDDPKATLAEPVFELLFDLLKEKLDIDAFKQRASEAIISFAGRIHSSIYEKWIILSLVTLLGSEEVYKCETAKPKNRRMENFAQFNAHIPVYTPLPEKTNRISWETSQHPMIGQPDFILNACTSGKYKYVAIKAGYPLALGCAKEPPRGHDWIPVEPGFNGYESLILLYTSDNRQALSLLSENNRLLRPDLVIKYLAGSVNNAEQLLQNMAEAIDILKPRNGLFLVSRLPSTLSEHIKPEHNLHFLETGLHKPELSIITDALFPPLNTTGEIRNDNNHGA